VPKTNVLNGIWFVRFVKVYITGESSSDEELSLSKNYDFACEAGFLNKLFERIHFGGGFDCAML